MDERVKAAVSQIVGQLKTLGFDPYVDVNPDRIGIIIPVSQLVSVIQSKVDRRRLNTVNLDFTVEEKTIGTQGFVVIKIIKKK